MEDSLTEIVKETGMIGDYLNPWAGIVMFYNSGDNYKICRLIKENPMPKYSERYPESKEKASDEVLGKIKRLDELADEANSLLSNNPFPDEDFKRIIIEVFYIVRGERLRVQRDPLNFYSE